MLTDRVRLKRDGTRAQTGFRLSTKRTSPFKSAGASVQSTTGSRGVRIGGSNAGYTMFRGSKEYWVPIPFASFPFTSPPVRYRVPSRFSWTLPKLSFSLLPYFLKTSIQNEVCSNIKMQFPSTFGISFPFTAIRRLASLSTSAEFLADIYSSVSQPPGRGPVPGPGINCTGPREVLLEFVICSFLIIFHE